MRLIGVALAVTLICAATGCKKLDAFSDAASADTSPGDTVPPTDIGQAGDTSPPADAGPDASDVPATWVTTFADPSTFGFGGTYIGLDTSGNVYVSALLVGKVTIGQATLGADDVESQVVFKLDPLGQPLWARQASPVDLHSSSGLLVGATFNMGFALDPASGASYVVGTFSKTITIGTTQLTAAGGKDVYVAKLDRDGKWLWAVRGGGKADDIAHAVAIDSYGPVVAGDFQGTATFGSNMLTSKGGADIFVAQLDYSNGSWINALAAGSNNPFVDTGGQFDAETAWAVASDLRTASGVYVSGRVQSGADFGSAGTLSGGNRFVALAELVPPKWKWARPVNRNNWCVMADRTSSKFLFTGGNLSGQGPTVAMLDITDGKDLLLLWAPSPEGYVFGLAQDHVGHIYAGGWFEETLQLTPDGKNTMTATGGNDGFFIKLDRHLALLWAHQISSPIAAAVYAMATDAAGAVYVTGAFVSQATFDGKTVTGQPSAGNAFVWKLTP